MDSRPEVPRRKQYRPPAGPMPTLGTLSRQEGGWVWLTCPSQLCLHRVAAHLTLFVQQLGDDFPSDKFRDRLWCTVCGRLGGQTYAPSWQGGFEATRAFPEEHGYYAHMERLDREGAFRHVVVDRCTGKLRRERLTAGQARNAARRYNERGELFEPMHFDQYRLAVAQSTRAIR